MIFPVLAIGEEELNPLIKVKGVEKGKERAGGGGGVMTRVS